MPDNALETNPLALTPTVGNFVVRDAQGNIVLVRSLTDNDIASLKQQKQDIETLKNLIKMINQGQRQLAYVDYFTDETHKDEMAVGVYYAVPFNAAGQFLEYDKATGKPKNPQTNPDVKDLVTAYFEYVYKNSDDTVNKVGRQELQVSFDDVAFLSATQTFTGENTFEKDVSVTATQDVDSLGDQKLATAKFVRDLANKKINEAGHLTSRFSETGEPTEDQLIANQLVFYAAVDLVA